MIRRDLRGEGAYSTLAERRSDTRGMDDRREDVGLTFVETVGGCKVLIRGEELSKRLLTMDKA